MSRHRFALAAAALIGVLVSACTTEADPAPIASMPPLVTSAATTSIGPVETTTTVVPAESTVSTAPPMTSTSTSTSSTTSTTTTIDAGPVEYTALADAANALVDGNTAVSVSVWRGGVRDYGFANGPSNDGRSIDTDSPFVIASVSKLVTAMSVARLVQQGRIDLAAPVPWDDMGVRHDPAWESITVRQLLAHTSGMPEARKTWLDDPGTCAVPLEQAMAAPPTDTLNTWLYSNGNYCALGLLVQHVTGQSLSDAAYQLVFAPAGITGPFLSTEGFRPDSAPYAKGLARLSRLGGAGTWLASTDDIAAMLASVTDADRVTLEWPGIILDQYGWGHTGSLDGAEACAWVLEDGYTIITAFVSGSKPNSGGKVCDRVVPALAVDLGNYAGDPIRTPD